ncbi:MAG: DUF4349 domain-containing protein [bacterium]|nr:DUF4349 domain-containing protein [bacterium]
MKKSIEHLRTWALLAGGTILALFIIVSAFGKFRTGNQTFFHSFQKDGYTMGSVSVGSSPIAMPNIGGIEPIMDEMMYAPEPPIFRTGGSTMQDLEGNVPDQRIIKNGNLSLRVEDVDRAMDRGRAIAVTRNGVIESSSVSDSGEGPRSAFIVLRVPADQFDATMTDLRGISVLVLNETTNAEDVTLQFVDLEADLRNAKAEEATYLRLLEKTGELKDVLSVTQQLAMVRQNIERLEGRKRFMENQTDLSTISVNLTEETRIQAPTNTWQPGEVMRDAVRMLVLGLQGLANFVIQAIIITIGLLLPIGLFIWFIVWVALKGLKKWMK